MGAGSVPPTRLSVVALIREECQIQGFVGRSTELTLVRLTAQHRYSWLKTMSRLRSEMIIVFLECVPALFGM